MTVSLYDFTIPTFSKGLNTLSHILDRAVEHAKQHGLNPDDYVSARLVEDMHPLAFQVHNATVTVKRTVARIDGSNFEPWALTEKTIDDLQRRIQLAREVIKDLDPTTLEKRAEVLVDFPVQKVGKTIKVPVREAILNHGIPNFFFHLQTAYSILRAQGVPIGKKDFLGSFTEEHWDLS